MTTTHTLPFGAHKGKPLAEVPVGYLRWVVSNVKLSTGLGAAVRSEIARRTGTAPPEPPPPPPRSCPRHPHAGMTAAWMCQRDGRRVIRGECPTCGASLGILPMTAENAALADANTDKAALLTFLTALEDAGIEVRRVRGHLRFEPYGKMTRELWALERQCRGLLLSMLIETEPARATT